MLTPKLVTWTQNERTLWCFHKD